jgi:hypothetical protein
MFASLLTQAAKKAFPNVSSNILALINVTLIGIIGMICAYVILSIPFTITNIVYIILTVICVWIGSMIGYDKVIQTIKQIRR